MKLRPLATYWSCIRRPVRLVLPAAVGAFSLLAAAAASADTHTGLGTLPAGADVESLTLVNAQKAHELGFTGAGTSVVVLDTGVKWSDPAFGCTEVAEPVKVCRVVLSADMNRNDQKDDDNGHGSNVAGIVAGVAPGTQLIMLDVFERGDRATDRAILGALNWAIQFRKQYNIVAVNMSLGSSFSYNKQDCSRETQYSSAFSQLRAAGIVPVVAAGNEGMLFGKFINGISSPACTPGGLSVGAVYKANAGRKAYEGSCTDNSRKPDQITCFSQSGPSLGMLAPGGEIKAASRTMSGTSQAAPHVAGAVAALASKCTAATDEQLIEALTTNGPKITDSRNNITKVRLDVVAAGQFLEKQGLCG